MLCIFPSGPDTMRRLVYLASTGCLWVAINFINVQNTHVKRLGWFKWYKVIPGYPSIHPWIWILSGFWVRIIIPVRGEWWAVHRPADKPPSLLSPVVGSPATLWSPRPALSSVRYHNTLFIPGRPDVKFITSPSTNIKSEIWIIDSLPKTYEMRSNAGIVMTRSKRQKFAYQGIRSGTQNIFYCERESWHRIHWLTVLTLTLCHCHLNI